MSTSLPDPQPLPRPPSPARSSLLRVVLAAVVAALVFIITLIVSRSHRSAIPSDDHVAQTLVSSDTALALDVPDALQVRYRDFGTAVSLVISARNNPVLLVDTNGNRTADNADLSFAALPDDKPCIGAPDAAGEPCGVTGSSAAQVHVTRNDTWVTAAWCIPKRLLNAGQPYADVVFQVFDGATQRAVNYPAPPFQKVYRLAFLDQAAVTSDASAHCEVAGAPPPKLRVDGASKTRGSPFSGSSRETSGARTAPEILRFEIAPGTTGGSLLQWTVKGTSSVRIDPGIGPVAAHGEHTLAAGGPTRYTLTATGPEGTISREVTLPAAASSAPVITSFYADDMTLQDGMRTHLHWSTAGPVQRVRLDPVAGNLPASGSQEVSPGQTTEYTLTAEGPGGSTSSRLVLHLAAPAPPPPPAISFSASPASVRPESRFCCAGA